jgi:nucleoside-diphosphate-sugar epimerase
MTTVAVTGATGFLGSALVRALAAQDLEIIALARPSSNRELLTGLNVTWTTGDVTDPDSLDQLAKNADWLVHAAGMLGRAGVAEQAYRAIHVTGTRNVLTIARHCKRVLYVSSPGVLGPINGPPADERAPLAPSNAYERSKAEAESVALAFAEHGLPVVIGRPEFVYGPGDRHVLGLFRAVKQGKFFYVSGGDNTCHPTYIDDAIDGLVRCLATGRPGEIYHIAGPRPVTFRELGETIAGASGAPRPRLSLPRSVAWLGASILELSAGVLGKQAPFSRSGVRFFSEDRRFSWEKAHKMLGYVPRYELPDGVQRTVAWYREEGLL